MKRQTEVDMFEKTEKAGFGKPGITRTGHWRGSWMVAGILAAAAAVGTFSVPTLAQGAPPPPYPQQPGYPPPQGYPPQPGYPPPQGYPPQGPPPVFAPQDLDRIVQRVALYPDPLLAQIMAAATYPDQIPDAARWADQHHYITGDALAGAITEDHLPWDPSVQALLPFPSVLAMMASDPRWTSDLGNAFLANNAAVMDAVQRERRLSYNYGYLRSNAQIAVHNGPFIEIVPANPNYLVVPYYDPLIVFAAPRPGFFVGGAIGFNFGITLGVAFRPWGWGYNRFAWGSHAVFINDRPWGRTWVNRGAYVHPYTVQRYAPGPAYRPVEGHALHEQSPREREAARGGRRGEEEHRR
jgi:hypothetical protein